jgi:hypothetical protein
MEDRPPPWGSPPSMRARPLKHRPNQRHSRLPAPHHNVQAALAGITAGGVQAWAVPRALWKGRRSHEVGEARATVDAAA